MASNGLLAQVAQAKRVAADLAERLARIGSMLRLVREQAGLSLRDVAPHVDLTAAGLSNIENGKALRITTIERVAEWYAEHHAA